MSDNGTTRDVVRLVDRASGEIVRSTYVLEAEVDAAQLLERILEGDSVRVAAQALGVSYQRAMSLYEEVLRTLADYRARLGELVLEDQLQRVEKVLTRLEPKVDQGGIGASEAYLKALDQRARLLNLYPTGQTGDRGAVNIQVNFNGIEPEEAQVIEGRITR